MNEKKRYSKNNSNIANDSKKLNRDDSEVSEGDVNVGLNDVQSIITQVKRDDPTIREKVLPRSTIPTKKRSHFKRIFCCYSKDPIINIPPSGDSNIGLIEADKMKNEKKILALDLDETLVHSSFQPVENASFILSVEIDGIVHSVFVMKRPGVDEFIKRMAKYYELIIYTASLSKYADPLLDLLDVDKVINKRLFREDCVFHDGHYVKDLSVFNRDISQCIIVDNSPMSYVFHPENAIDCSSYFDDPTDIELWQIADFLENIRSIEDVRPYCRYWREWCRNNPSSVPYK